MEKMPNITLQQSREYLAQKKPFKASNFFAVRDLQGNYLVYSYATVIAVVFADGRENYLDNSYYSRTTSRHQSIIKQHL